MSTEKRNDPSQQQQQSGKRPAGQQQQEPASGEGQQYGEGSYSGTRQYNEALKDHVEHHDIEREARDAAPRTAAEEKEMEDAERIAASRARPGKGSPDDPEDEKDLTN